MNDKELYSFIIPAYNEEKNIFPIYNRLTEVLKKINGKYEIIFVNDGSKDGTLAMLLQLSEKDSRVKLIDFSRNFGHQVALSAGYAHASGDAVISLDCDMQDPPEIIAQMIEKWKQGHDVIYARRIKRHDRFFKKYTAILYYKILHGFSDVQIPRDVGDFRLIDKKVLHVINKMPESSKYLRGMVAWVGFKHTFVDFERPERIHGETHYSIRQMIHFAMDGLIGFSSLPLKLGLLLGVLSISLGLVFIVYMTGDSLINNVYYPLYKWLIVVLFVFLGFNFILVWILGEYIGRIYNESKMRPYYIIKEKVNFVERVIP